MCQVIHFCPFSVDFYWFVSRWYRFQNEKNTGSEFMLDPNQAIHPYFKASRFYLMCFLIRQLFEFFFIFQQCKIFVQKMLY